MVSTRGVRYKFSEGERVLCYEPDPTKAKVLYDSKVLEVIESKDKRGRRTVEYLIHFQGWNSSWDRCVSEDFVLKDTEENRQLQRDLAEKSQLQLGAYLYRRERKKGGSASTGAGPAKRARHGFSDDGSSTSTQPDEGETAGDTDSSLGSGSSSQAPTPPPNANIGRALIALPPVLRDRLTFDYHLVAKRGRLSRLPAVPSAAEILESFVKWFARSGAWRPARARPDPPHRPDLLDVCCRLNLVREVADGLRVYFDFILQGHLLYKQEQNQYHEVCGQFVEKLEPIVKTEEEENPDLEEATMSLVEDIMKSPNEYAHLPPDPVDSDKSEEASGSQTNTIGQTPTEISESSNKSSADNNEDNSNSNSDKNEVNKTTSENSQVTTRANSDKNEVNHKANSDKNEVSSKSNSEKNENNKTSIDKSDVSNKSSSDKKEDNNEPSSDKNEVSNNAGSDKNEVGNKSSVDKPSSSEETNNKGQIKSRELRCATRSGNLARRLRSHKSAVSQSETEEPAPSTSTGEPRETLSSSIGSSGSSISSGWLGQRAAPVAPVATQNTRTPLSLLLDKVAKWQIIPREGTEHLPCRVYGAIHLSRLFVKLPDFLNAMAMPDMKLKLILKHIDMFVQYLEEHNEWFGEMYYVADSSSRSR